MFRRLFTLLSALSLLLCVGVVVLWVRSDRKNDLLHSWYEDGRTYELLSDRHGFSCTSFPALPDGTGLPGYYVDHWNVPHFVAFSLTAAPLLPCLSLLSNRLYGSILRKLQERRSHQGLCAACGYDLRATPSRCPECGVAPSKLGRGG